MTSSHSAEALYYARRGWAVFPLAPRSKEPMAGTRGYLDATVDEGRVRHWWTASPDANIGIAPDGAALWILDVDPRHGGDESLDQLQTRFGKLPETPLVLTGGGGRHFYFCAPQAAPVPRRIGVRPGLDALGRGGYAVAPKSLHPNGNPYAWELSSSPTDVGVAEAPAWLTAIVLDGAGSTKERNNGKAHAPAIGSTIPDGERHSTLVSLAGSMRRRGAEEEEILAALLVANQKRCKPPLDAKEVEFIARDVVRRYDPAEHPKQRERSKAIVRPFADIAPLPVDWLFQGRLPAAMPSLVIGDGGVGKGSTMCDLAARLSKGEPMPDGTGGGTPRVVLWVTGEDDPARTLRARFDAAGADVSRVRLLTVRDTSGEERELVLSADDIKAMEVAIVEHHASLVVIDPIAANVPSSVDEHRDADLRRVLSPLAKVAGRTGAAIVGVKHLGKDTSRGALQRICGGVAWGNASRCVLAVGVDPHDENSERRILAHVKSNVSELAPSLAFRLTTGEGESVARVEWLGPCEVSADELLGAPMDAEERSTFAFAAELLRELLPPGVEVAAKTVQVEAKRRDVSIRTLARVKRVLGVRSRQPGGAGSPWVWWLPPGTLAVGSLGKNGTGGLPGADSVQDAKGFPGILGGNGRKDPANGVLSQDAKHQDAKEVELAPWTSGHPPKPCLTCKSDAESRDSKGEPRHPWCIGKEAIGGGVDEGAERAQRAESHPDAKAAGDEGEDGAPGCGGGDEAGGYP